MQCMRVDLPEPDGPMIAVSLPRSRSTLTPGEGVHLGVALAVGLDQVAGAGDDAVLHGGPALRRAGVAGVR